MKNLGGWFVFLVVLAIAGCQGPTSKPERLLSSFKEITKFEFPALSVWGEIVGTNIAVNVPYGTEVTSLVAKFSTTGKTVLVGDAVQTSGTTANDFTSPVTYSVVAEDGTHQNYQVTVTVASSSDKAITAFGLVSPAVVGVITGNSIAITVPYGTSTTGLVAEFSTTGSSVKVGSTAQVSGSTSNDFSSPVSYVVTAADSSTQTYVVTVTVAASSAKAITAFSILSPAVTGTIDGTNIAVTVPYGTAVTSLVAVFTTTGTSVKVGTATQTSGTTARNFSSPVTYTVTAADGSTQDYLVTVTVALNPAKSINFFTIATPISMYGSVNSTAKTVTVLAPAGTSVSNLTPTITITGASVSPASGVAQDFTNPVTYTVTAADGSTQAYTVTFTFSNWSVGKLPMSGTQLVAFGNGTFVSIASYTATAATSTDGVNWTAHPLPSSEPWTALTYGNGLFVAVAGAASYPYSNVAATSPDGVTWTKRTLSSSQYWRAVTYGNGVFIAGSAYSPVSNRSTDGITWTDVSFPITASGWKLAYGNSTFVAVANATSSAATSSDGTAWTSRTLPQSDNWNAVTFGNGQFVAVSYNSTGAATSPDGVTWTARTLPSAATWQSIAYGNGLYVAVAGGSAHLAYSSDGISWTEGTLPTVSSAWGSVVYGNGVWVQVGWDLSLAAAAP